MRNEREMRGEGPRRGGGGSTSPRARRLAAQFPDLEVEGFHGPLGPLSLSRPWRSGEGRRAGGRGRAGVVGQGGTGRGRAWKGQGGERRGGEGAVGTEYHHDRPSGKGQEREGVSGGGGVAGKGPRRRDRVLRRQASGAEPGVVVVVG